MRQKLFYLLNHKFKIANNIFDYSIIILIMLSIVIVIAESFQNLPPIVLSINRKIEYFTIVVFIIEYVGRLVTADYLYKDLYGEELYEKKLGPVRSRVKFIFSFLSIIDLCAILPFFISALTVNLLPLRTIRLLRLLRLFKLNRYTTALSMVSQVIKNKSYQLITSFFVVFLIIITSSIIMFYVEYRAQPTVFDDVFSGFWWSVSTITTVCYGDIYPVTLMGRILSTFISFMGLGMLAIWTGILSSGFKEQTERKECSVYCRHCGKKL